jgi:glycine/D-amino acid oxidase-like deaminating enzyme
LISPTLDSLSGSQAALGMLMANVFHRSKGRSWRLRQQSLALFQQWQQELEAAGYEVPIKRGLWLLASNPDQFEKQQLLVENHKKVGINLKLISQIELKKLIKEGDLPDLSDRVCGAIWSEFDGQLNPKQWMQALLKDSQNYGLEIINGRIDQIKQDAKGWRLVWEDWGDKFDWVLICAGLASEKLIAPLMQDFTAEFKLQPVLGQALELELPGIINWRGSLNWEGFNLVPLDGNRLWLGATLEPGLDNNKTGTISALEAMRNLNGLAPYWLRQAKIIKTWQGARAQPINQAAPLLKQPLPGLCVLAGHYRNGILLGPASAAWVAKCISQT